MQHTLFAVALGTLIVHAALANRTAFSEPPNNRDNETVFCIAQYAPATCSGVYGGEHYVSTGTNTCVAVNNMVQEINDAYLWFMEVRAEDIQRLVCNDIPGTDLPDNETQPQE